jgi:hypothetical protein
MKKELEARFSQTNPADDTQVAGLRREFTSRSEPFIAVRDGYSRVLTGAEAKNPQGDMTLVYGYMKLLDPGSVVREGEYATAQNAAGIPERVRAMWNKLIDGDKLTDEQRSRMAEQAKGIFDKQKESQGFLEEEFRRLAKKNRMDPERVIVDYMQAFRRGKPTATPAQRYNPQTGKLEPVR